MLAESECSTENLHEHEKHMHEKQKPGFGLPEQMEMILGGRFSSVCTHYIKLSRSSATLPAATRSLFSPKASDRNAFPWET